MSFLARGGLVAWLVYVIPAEAGIQQLAIGTKIIFSTN